MDEMRSEPSEGISTEGAKLALKHSDQSALTARSMMVLLRSMRNLEKKAPLLKIDDWMAVRWLGKEGMSSRKISREFGITRKTVAKYKNQTDAPKYTLKQPRGKPVSNNIRAKIEQILEADKHAPRKQRHTATRIYDRLVKEDDYEGSARTVRYVVADIRNRPAAKASIPLLFQPGKDAQVDFEESYAHIGGQLTKLQGFEMRLNYSRRKFIQFFPSTDKEAFLEGHVRAFEHFGGVVERLSYDNLGAAVAQMGKGKQRKLTYEFKGLIGYYNFQTNFCQPGIEGAHEKGGIESSVGFSRRNWMVPPPHFDKLEDLNSYIQAKCEEDESRTVDGQSQTIGEAWQLERPLLSPLPARPFDPVVKYGGLVDNYCTVSLKDTHYSVPAKFVGKGLTILAYWNRVQISDGLTIIAEHPRCYKKDEYILSPEHYLDLLERRPHAVPYARPLLQHEWPGGYWEFYQKMVAAVGPGPAGKDFIRILKSHVKYGAELVRQAISKAAALGITNADFVLNEIDQMRWVGSVPEPVDLKNHEALASVKVTMSPEPAEYNALFNERGVSNDGERVA
jgi:transposase